MRRQTKAWFWRVLLSVDQFANVLLSPLLNLLLHPDNPDKFGYEDETLSSVFGKNRARCPACYWVCRALHRLDPGHCDKSIEQIDEGQQ